MTNRLYIGRYKDDIIAVSEDKTILIDYLEKNRLFKKNEYTIEKIDGDLDYISILYEDTIITPFYGLMIPKIDQLIIEQDYSDMDNDIEKLINRLNYYAFIIHRDKKTREHTNSIINAIKSFESITSSDKKRNTILKNHMLGHPIIKCTYEEYLSMINRYNTTRGLNERFKYLCHNEE